MLWPRVRNTLGVSSGLLADPIQSLRQNAERAAILLDIDGTLAPIVEHAAEAHVPEPTRRLLIPVARRFRLVACVSGRQASQARAMVSIGSITYLGSHGAELLRSGWTEARLDPAVQEWTRRIREFTRAVDTSELRRVRVRVEDKGPITAFHWRGARDEAAARTAVQALAGQAEAAGLVIHWGRKVLEVRPPVRIDKGAGIRSLLADAEIDYALYAGDDVTDLDAFRTLAELKEEGQLLGAVRVGVASEEGPEEIRAHADLVVEGTEGVGELLAQLGAP
jgi:trehalose 6-phosphate phosphatase